MEKFKSAGLNSAAPQSLGVQAAHPSTEFDIVNLTLSFAHDVVDRAESLANRLCGCQPTPPATNGSISETPDGVLPRMAMQADYARSRLSDAMAALERIERSLP